MTILRRFFPFYGSKWRLAPKYPAPKYDMIVEPFAGSAGYSTRYYDREVVLIEKDPIIRRLWEYLIAVDGNEISKIPVEINHVEELSEWDSAVRSLVGFWFNQASTRPGNQRTTSSRLRPKSNWSAETRDMLASQVEHIKHWHVYDETKLESTWFLQNRCTWFLDPPYQKGGQYYRCGSKDIDYKILGVWCQILRGQVIVCESEGADWLPFQFFSHNKGQMTVRNGRTQSEVIYYQEDPA